MPRTIDTRKISAFRKSRPPSRWLGAPLRRRASVPLRRFPPCPLENGNKATPAGSPQRPECRVAPCHDSPAGETVSPPPSVFSLWNQKLLPCAKISVANQYVDLHNM